MSIFSGLGTAGRAIVSFGANLRVNIEGAEKLGRLGKTVSKLQKNFINLGVTTIFLDRLVQSLSRAWDILNRAIGVQRLAQAGSQMLRLAQFTGVSTDRLQAFASAATAVGAEIEDVSDLFQTLAERVSDLRAGEKGISEDFARFGITKTTFDGAIDSLDMFLRLAEKLDHLKPEERLAAAEKILGGDLARKFGQMMEGGTAGVVTLMDEAIRTGQVLSKAQLQSADRFAKAQRRLGRLFVALSNNLGTALLPVLTDIADVLSSIVAMTSTFFNSRAASFALTLQRAFTPLLDKLKEIRDFIDRDVRPLGDYLARVGQGLLVITGALSVAAFGQVIGAAVAIGAISVWVANLIDDILSMLRGEQSWIGSILADAPALQIFLKGVFDFMAGIQEFAAWTVDAFNQLAKGPLMPILIALLGVIFTVLGSLLHVVGSLLSLFVRVLNVVVEFVSLLIQGTTILLGEGMSRLLGIFQGRGFTSSQGMQRATGAFWDRLGTAGGVTGALGNAFTGAGPTTTEMLLMGGAQSGGGTTVNQTNNITATSSNPAGFTSSVLSTATHTAGLVGGK